jgi:hypothetical protein
MSDSIIPLQAFKYRPAEGETDRGFPSKGWRDRLDLESQEQAGEPKHEVPRINKTIVFAQLNNMIRFNVEQYQT